MDKGKQAIACGSPRNRSMRLVDSLTGNNKTRILLYGTEKRAVAAFSGGLGFYDETDGYIKRTYRLGGWKLPKYDDICIPVKVELVIDED